MDVIFKARHTDVLERFRKHATAKLAKIEKLDSKAIRVDVEISAERNPRQAGRKERVELTVTSRGPTIRAEAAAEDKFVALDMAFAKLESRLRRACDRRKGRHGAHAAIRLTDLPEADLASGAERPAIRISAGGGLLASNGAAATAAMAKAAEKADVAADAASDAASEAEAAAAAAAGLGPEGDPEDVVAVEMQGDGPLVVRQKFHAAVPMGIDQALFEMELVGHDFFLFTDAVTSLPSVVYRRRGYQYGVIRLVEEHAPVDPVEREEAGDPAALRRRANGQVRANTSGPAIRRGADIGRT